MFGWKPHTDRLIPPSKARELKSVHLIYGSSLYRTESVILDVCDLCVKTLSERRKNGQKPRIWTFIHMEENQQTVMAINYFLADLQTNTVSVCEPKQPFYLSSVLARQPRGARDTRFSLKWQMRTHSVYRHIHMPMSADTPTDLRKEMW